MPFISMRSTGACTGSLIPPLRPEDTSTRSGGSARTEEKGWRCARPSLTPGSGHEKDRLRIGPHRYCRFGRLRRRRARRDGRGRSLLAFGRHLEPWMSGDLFSKHGHMVPTGEKTQIWLVPVAAGLRYVARVGRLRLHAGGGVAYHFFKERAPIGEVTDGAWSATAEGGCRIPLSKTWDLSLI